MDGVNRAVWGRSMEPFVSYEVVWHRNVCCWAARLRAGAGLLESTAKGPTRRPRCITEVQTSTGNTEADTKY